MHLLPMTLEESLEEEPYNMKLQNMI
jgi:hypothetical protein